MYSYVLDEELVRILKKLAKKDKISYVAVQKQIIKIAKNPDWENRFIFHSLVREGYILDRLSLSIK